MTASIALCFIGHCFEGVTIVRLTDFVQAPPQTDKAVRFFFLFADSRASEFLRVLLAAHLSGCASTLLTL